MDEPFDGGAAFPSDNIGKNCQRGMSLRSWLAGQALAGMLAASAVCPDEEELPPEEYARDAVRYADALIAELGGTR